jgi:maleylpyruvate isomerase
MTDPGLTEIVGPPTAAVLGCIEAHGRLTERLELIDDVVIARPSRLPGWTIGHVLTHLARNADSLADVLEAAADGHSVPQYPGGLEQRAGDIEEGATRSAAACANDVRRAAKRIEAVFAELPDRVWDAFGVGFHGEPSPCRTIPFRRWTEVEFHHVDLGLGYEPENWPAEFVSLALVDTLNDLPPRIVAAGQRASMLAWLAGRSDAPGQIDFEEY